MADDRERGKSPYSFSQECMYASGEFLLRLGTRTGSSE